MGPVHRYEQVYFVQSSKIVNPVAIRPEIFDDVVTWQDTSKGKIVELKKIERPEILPDTPPDILEITANDGTRYKLTKLTLDIYNKNVKKRVASPPDFHSDEEVQNFYLTSDFEPY